MILTNTRMSTYKKIIIFLSAFLTFHCAPGIHFRKNNITDRSINSQNDSFFEWSNNVNKFHDEESDLNNSTNNNSVKEKFSVIDDVDDNINNSLKKNNINKSKMPFKKDFIPEKSYLAENKIKENTKKVTAKYKTYRVKKGDTLLKISKKYNISLREIVKINNLEDDDRIYTGMTIKIPVKGNTGNPGQEKKFADSVSPNFVWPVKCVHNTRRDGQDGVKPIGIIITSNYENSVSSSADGIIEKVGSMRGFGNYVIVKHNNKFLTIYSNLKDIKVSEGNRIRKGEILGKLEGNKLHFQIDRFGKPEDPFIYLSRLN